MVLSSAVGNEHYGSGLLTYSSSYSRPLGKTWLKYWFVIFLYNLPGLELLMESSLLCIQSR